MDNERYALLEHLMTQLIRATIDPLSDKPEAEAPEVVDVVIPMEADCEEYEDEEMDDKAKRLKKLKSLAKG